MTMRKMCVSALVPVLASLTACEGAIQPQSESAGRPEGAASDVDVITASLTVPTASALPACNGSFAGITAFVTDTSSLLRCASRRWINVPCNVDLAGTVAYASDSATLLACSARSWRVIELPTGTEGTNGLNSLIVTQSEAAGANCASGGTRVHSGLDADRNGVLDAGEVSGTAYVCNGSNGTDGMNGANGRDGADGYSALSATLPEPAGPNCATGGLKFLNGQDLDRDNTLDDPAEVSATNYICNGLNGGTGGSSGVPTVVSAASEAGGANCAAGGVAIFSGPDTNGNGQLDPAEIASASYACSDPTQWNGSSPVIITANTDFDATPYLSVATGTSATLATAQITVPVAGQVLAIASTKVYCDDTGEPTWNCVPAPDFTTGWLSIAAGETGGTGTSGTSTYVFLTSAIETQLTTTEVFSVGPGTSTFRSLGFAGAVDDGSGAVGTGHVAYDIWDLTLVFIPN